MFTYNEIKAFCNIRGIEFELNQMKNGWWEIGINNLAGRRGKSEWSWTWFESIGSDLDEDTTFCFRWRYSSLNGRQYKSTDEWYRAYQTILHTLEEANFYEEERADVEHEDDSIIDTHILYQHTNRIALARRVLGAMSDIEGFSNGSVINTNDLASSEMSDHKDIIEHILSDGEVEYNDGWYIVEVHPFGEHSSTIYVALTAKAEEEEERSITHVCNIEKEEDEDETQEEEVEPMTRKDLHYLLAEVSQRFVHSFKEDILYDLESMESSVEREDIITMLVRETGFDLIDRFERNFDHPISIKEAIEEAKRTLGFDVAIRVNSKNRTAEIMMKNDRDIYDSVESFCETCKYYNLSTSVVDEFTF